MPIRSDVERSDEATALLPLHALIAERSVRAPHSPVIEADGMEALSNLALYELYERTRAKLAALGFGAHSRIAVTASPGPEFAAAVTVIAATAACAPINPALGRTEWREMLIHLRIDALVAPKNSFSAREAAEALGLPLLNLVATTECGAGTFDLVSASTRVATGAPEQVAGLDDTAFVLATSGTTSRPKVVPLTHRNIANSAHNTGAALMLTEADRLIGVLPVHHAHGLISGLMATLYAGGCIIMMRAFSTDTFFEHLARFRPTWLTAVPAIHQAILDAAPKHRMALQGHRLRLVRSASAPLPAARFKALSDLFGVPVIETYGMTEAASQIASTPLEDWSRKPGSVGKAAGPEIVVLDENDAPLAANLVGEIALRGPNMTLGYDDQVASAEAFTKDGWFRTGDLGRLDDDGFLYIVGRLKEVINRGGAKILPGKIEAVLTRHHSVAEAAAFGLPHERLGEDVAVAVVAAKDAEINEAELRAFALASGDLSEAEVPRRVIQLALLPKTFTGKIQRALLAESFRAPAPAAEPSATIEEAAIIEIWREVFGLSKIGATDDFFHLGGDSLMGVEVAMRIAEDFDVKLTLRALFDAPTPRSLAKALRETVPQAALFRIRNAPKGTMQKTVSISQERILSLEAAMPGLPTHMVPIVYFISGQFDPMAFEKALRMLIARHEVFRTIYRKVAGKWTVIPTAAVNLRLTVEDWCWASILSRESFINDALENEIWDVTDPTRSAPLRTRLLKFDKESHALVLIFHHIAMDAWTIRTFIEEVFQHYEDLVANRPLSRSDPTCQFAEFADWQRRWSEGNGAADQRTYWMERLAGLSSIFPKRDGFTATGLGFTMGRANFAIGQDIVDGLVRRSKAAGATLFMGLLAATKVFLHQKVRRSDIGIVIPMANRSRPATRDVMGLIANNACIRTNAAAQGFDATLSAVRSAVLDADAHQELPFEIVLDDLGAADQAAAAALSDVYLSLVEHFEPEISGAGLSLYRMEHDQSFEMPLPMGNTKLLFLLKLVDGEVIGSFQFKTSLFSQENAETFVEEFVASIVAIGSGDDAALAL